MSEALNYVYGMAAGIDLTRRDHQLEDRDECDRGCAAGWIRLASDLRKSVQL